MEKLKKLEEWLKREERVVVAFSGGIDSALLVVVAERVLGKNMIAMTGDSASVPSRDREFVQEFCNKYGVEHKFIVTNEFEIDKFRTNSKNRCYYCKGELYKTLISYAKLNNCRSVLDGTNASDLTGHRPGYKAIIEIDGVKAPYAELGITKEDIRSIASELGIAIADKPASACLSSRIPWGEMIEPKDLRQVDDAENILRDMGFSQVRVRHHGKLARVQCIYSELALVVEKRKEIEYRLKELGYENVTLDLNCYAGF